jgi:CRISPR-associated endonuclease Cas2
MNQEPSVVFTILDALINFGRLLPMPFETPYEHVKRMRRFDPDSYGQTVWKMQKRGVLKVVKKNGKKFLKITKKGEIQTLLEKAKMSKPQKWDGKWRLVTFDIPEDHRDKRDLLRGLLRKNNFYKLQASVFINPYPLNRAAVAYLKETGLISYIRILRVDEMDDDKFLIKRFKLKYS